MTNPNECIICGYNRHTDRCHLIPKRFMCFVEGYTNHATFNTPNIVLMCKNHHWEYDHDLISDNDYVKLINELIRKGDFLKQYSDFVCGKVELIESKRYSKTSIMLVHKANEWIIKTRSRLDKLGFLKDNI